MITGYNVSDNSQVSREEEMALEFGHRAECDRQESAELLHGFTPRPFGDIGRNRHRSSRNLITQAESMTTRESIGQSIDVESKAV